MRRVLIANRGEIAYRLLLACRERGLETVAVFATPDADAPYVGLADAAYELVGETPAATYLDQAAVLAIARESGADALHPGYGFLSEHAGFAAAVEAAGLTWIGPPAGAIAAMGHKLQARQAAAAAGVPVLPGGLPAERPGAYPVMVKAACGGGGLGLRRVDAPAYFDEAVAAARAQCAAAFASDEVYWEAYLAGARHIEVQVAADLHGNVRHLGARECSVQRRFQKLIEECPPATLDAAAVEAAGALAERVASAVGYRNLGTVEFLWTPESGPVFLEMNTRLQVEHPVTELVLGLDLPQLQLALAAGERLDPAWSARGHAIEARVYAEDPATGAPAAGRIDHLRWPAGPWIRVDAGVEAGQDLPTTFDALLAKVIAWGPSRDVARRRLADALARTEVAGSLQTNLAQLRAVLDNPAFAAGALHTGFLAEHALALPAPDEAAARAIAAAVTRQPAESVAAAPHPWARRAWR